MINYEIKKITEVKEQDLFNFYKVVFKERYKTLKSHYRWWYRLNNSPCEPLLVTVNEKIVGQMATVPTKIKLFEQEVNACFFIDFAILDEFQGKGAGTYLVKEASRSRQVQIAFCNEAALKIYKKLGWNINYESYRILRPINPTKWLPVVKNLNFSLPKYFYNFILNKKFNKIENINPNFLSPNFDELFENFKKRRKDSSKPLKFLRDEEWFIWRFKDYPFKDNLRFFEYKGNYLIINTLIHNNIKRFHIIYHFYVENELKKEIYYLASKWALKNSYDLIWSCSSNQQFINEVSNLMPKNLAKSLTIASFSNDKIIFNNLNNNFSNIQAADNDLELLYV